MKNCGEAKKFAGRMSHRGGSQGKAMGEMGVRRGVHGRSAGEVKMGSMKQACEAPMSSVSQSRDGNGGK